MKKPFLTFCLLLLFGIGTQAQTLLNENVNYKSGGLTGSSSGANVSGGNWTSFSGSGFPLTVPSAGLSSPGYGSSGIGNSISMVGTTASAEDAYRQFPAQTSGTVYCAVLLKVTDTIGLAANTNANPDYFSGFITSSSTTLFVSRLCIRKGSTGNTYQIGIKGNTASTAAFAAVDLKVDSTQLIVFSYSIVTGTNNDSARLWVNPSTVSMPATADAKSSITASGDAADIARIFLRQGAAGTPNCSVDGIHVGLTWTDIMGSADGPVPPANTVSFVPSGFTTSSFSWNRPGDYNAATMQTIAFLKKTTPVTISTPTKAANFYTANTDFSATGTAYENDALAKCVFNGDTNTVSISGLTLATSYYLSIMIVRDADTVYSTATSTIGTTQANKPGAVTNGVFSATSFNNTTLTWTKPLGYIDSNMTVLVFLKQSSPVSPTGTVNASPTLYIANSNFSGGGTKFLNDTNAKCIYNGDGNTVPITGLNTSTNYFATIYVVRSTDSDYYSNPFSTSVGTINQPGAVTALNLSGTGQTTAIANWTKPAGYNNASMTTLVFVKQATAVTTVAHPTKSVSGYVANADFTANGTIFQYDSLAKCVMNSDSSKINITGLLMNTPYHVLVYVVRSDDSVYSIASNSNGITYGAVAPPMPVTSVSFRASSVSTATYNWTKDSSFIDTAHTVLVFLKKGSAIVQGAPTYHPDSYTANEVFGTGTAFQNDTSAKCVYKGIGTSVAISGLQPSSSYYLVAYAVRASDSAYSSAIVTNTTTMSNPVTGITVVGQSGTSTKISWIKPSGYVNNGFSTLVFVKAENAITEGIPTRIPSSYTSSTSLGFGTKYQNDSLAYCVFRADTNFVTVSNLVQNKNYTVLILVVHDADSVYSAAATGNGTTLPPAAPVSIGSINTTNATTGNPDSLGVRITVRGLVYGFNQTNFGLKFLLRDITGGITVVNTTKNFTYTVAEGDSIEVQGSVSTTRGLVCVTIDTLLQKATGKTIKTPTIVSAMGETTENDLVQINTVKFITTPGRNWTATTYQLLVIASSDTIALRILNGSGLVGTPTPTTPTFSVMGMGSQTSTSFSAPFANNGYQLIPRYESDIIVPDTLSAFHLAAPLTNDVFTIGGDTSTLFIFNWTRALTNGSSSPSYTFMLDTFGGNFTMPKIQLPSDGSGADSVLRMSVIQLSTLLGLKPGSTYKLIWKVKAETTSLMRYSDEVNELTLIRNPFTGLQQISSQPLFELYPNPATNFVSIRFEKPIQSVTILNELGQVIVEQKANTTELTVSTSDLSKGIYFVRIETTSGIQIQKLLVN